MIERIEATEIKAIASPPGSFTVEVLGLPFYGPIHGKDLHRQYLSPRTETRMKPGDEIPAVYYHGINPTGGKRDPQPEFYGNAVMTKIDEKGGWFQVTVAETKRHAARLYKAAVSKTLRASSGVAGRLARVLPSGELSLYVPGEMSLFDQGYGRIAINNLAIGILKAIYDEADLTLPEGLQEEARQKKIKIVFRNYHKYYHVKLKKEPGNGNKK